MVRRNHHTPPSRFEHPELVYFLIRGAHIKIGTTKNLPRRVRTMQQPLSDVLAVMPGSFELEHEWHRRFAHLNDRTVHAGHEWFHATDELLEAIASEAITSRAGWEQAVTGEASVRTECASCHA